MTKLAEWLVTGITLVIVWYNVLIGKLPNLGLTQSQILIAPLVIVGVIACLVLLTLIQRVRSFRDCPEAAAELRKQIEEAKTDLKSQGFKSE
jgi:dolichyl-phosphate mannosyltransferase polypeptide 3